MLSLTYVRVAPEMQRVNLFPSPSPSFRIPVASTASCVGVYCHYATTVATGIVVLYPALYCYQLQWQLSHN